MKIHETSSFILEGHVSSGFEPVRDLFRKKYELGCEENSQLCVYVNGKKVVDLWGRLDKTNGFDGDSLTTVFSNTKTLTSIMMAIAVDKGWIKYEDKICKHWPEFGQNGKEEITIEDLLKHEAGLNWPNFPLEPKDFVTQNVKNNSVGDKIAGMKPSWPKNHKRHYHPLTRGWIENEIFRRVNPTGATLAEFLQKEIASVHGVDTYISCERKNYYPCRMLSTSYILSHGLRNTLKLESGIVPSLGLLRIVRPITQAISEELHPSRQIKGMKDLLEFCEPHHRLGEHPGCGGNCSARGMAKLASIMSFKGTDPEGKSLISESAWKQMHDNVTSLEMMGTPFSFSQGGICKAPEGSNNEGYYGWNGYGGSSFQWHPELKIGFAYTCSLLYPFITLNTKAEEFKEMVINCAKTIKK